MLVKKRVITKIIIQVLSDYIKKYDGITLHNAAIMKCSSAYDINNGFCADFACDVLKFLGCFEDKRIRDDVFELSSDMFMTDDVEFAKSEWGELIIEDEIAWSKHMLNLYGFPERIIYLPSHVWIYHKGKHYDAECPNGIEQWFKLPIFKNYFCNIN